MISRDLTLTITDTNVSLDRTIILYRYDRGITLNLSLKSETYRIGEEITKARAIILRPNKKLSATDIKDIKTQVEGTYYYELYLDDTWTDHLGEVGNYQIQLQLYSDNPDDECITIAPFTFEVRNPIGIPQGSPAYAGQATTGNYSVTRSTSLPTGDLENGEYEETEWIDGDLITSGKLNKIESVIDYLVGESANHATEQYVQDKILEVETGGADLSVYALKADIPTAVSQLENDKDYATVATVTAKITAANLKKADKDHTHDGYISSTDITRIEIVDALPETEEDGVLYIVKK